MKTNSLRNTTGVDDNKKKSNSSKKAAYEYLFYYGLNDI